MTQIDQKEFDTIDEAEAWVEKLANKYERKGIEVKSALAFSSMNDRGDLVFVGEVMVATE
jgi:predicted ATPase